MKPSHYAMNDAVAKKLGWTYDKKLLGWSNPEGQLTPVPLFSTDIRAAWEIVRQHCHSGILIRRDEDDFWYASWSPNRTPVCGQGETAAEAICSLFLYTPPPGKAEE